MAKNSVNEFKSIENGNKNDDGINKIGYNKTKNFIKAAALGVMTTIGANQIAAAETNNQTTSTQVIDNGTIDLRQKQILPGSPERIQELRNLIDVGTDELGFLYFYENYPELAEAMIEESYTNMYTAHPDLTTYKKVVNMLAGAITGELEGRTNRVGKAFMNKFLKVNILESLDAGGSDSLDQLSEGLKIHTENEIEQLDKDIAEARRIQAEARKTQVEEEQKIAEEEQKIAEEEQKIKLLDNINENLNRL